MVQQNFKEPFPKTLVFDFLEKYCEKISKCYIFTKLSFQLANQNGDIQQFTDRIKPHYYKSKKKYAEREQTYTSFMTIIRQMCRYHNIGYSSKIKYIKSYYEMVYFINKCD